MENAHKPRPDIHTVIWDHIAIVEVEPNDVYEAYDILSSDEYFGVPAINLGGTALLVWAAKIRKYDFGNVQAVHTSNDTIETLKRIPSWLAAESIIFYENYETPGDAAARFAVEANTPDQVQ
jgi:hypothetical protein